MSDNTNIPEDSMVLDTNAADFDFFSLEDPNIQVVNPDSTKASKAAKAEPEEVEEGDDTDEVEFDDNDPTTNYDDEDDEEEVDEDESDEAEEASEEDSEEPDEEVDYEGYEVTLPNGEVVKLDEAVKGYKASEALESERHDFEEAKNKFIEETKDVQKGLELAYLECQKVEDDYKDFDWATLARTDPAAYVDNKEFLEKYMERKQELIRQYKVLNDKRDAEMAVAKETQARQCVTELARDIPQWGPELYQTLMEYGVENGASPEEMQACVDPKIFKMMFKAMQFDKGSQVAKAKVSAVVKQPTKVVKNTRKESPTSAKAQKVKGFGAGLSEKESLDMFSMLED